MKQLTLTLCTVLFCFSIASAQELSSNPVTNVRAELVAGGEKIKVRYDLPRQGTQQYFDVKVTVFIDELRVFPKPAHLDGDAGPNIRYGNNKEFTWDVYQTVERIAETAQLQFLVEANPVVTGLELTPPSTDAVLGIGTITAGTALVGLGINSLISGDVKTYKEDCDPTSESFRDNDVALTLDNQTRSVCDNKLEDAKNNLPRGRLLTAAGAVIITGGMLILAKKPFLKRWENKQLKKGLSFEPHIELQNPKRYKAGIGTSLGLKLRYQF